MLNIENLAQLYLLIGAGGLCVIVLVWLAIYQTVKTASVLKAVQETIEANDATHTEVIRNNTEAVREVARSNENVAKALGMLDASLLTMRKSMERHDDLMISHDERARVIAQDVIILKEKQK